MGALYLAVRSRKENIELKRLVKAAQINGYSIAGKDIIRSASLIRQYAKIKIRHVKSEEYLDVITVLSYPLSSNNSTSFT